MIMYVFYEAKSNSNGKGETCALLQQMMSVDS